jgi:hypothetical protein
MYVERAINSDMAAIARATTGEKAAKTSADKSRNWSVDTDTAGFVRKAMSLPLEISPATIEEARELIASGQLDSATAIRQVAAAVVNLGI